MNNLLARWARRVAVALPLACGVVVAASVPAHAHHPAVTAAVDCDGRVSFTVVAWEGFPDDPATAENERELSRTNGEIAVSVSLDGGQVFRQLPADGGYRLDAGNAFTFTDSFQLPDPLPSTVILRARGVQTWGTSDEQGGTRQTPAIRVAVCDETARDTTPPGDGYGYGTGDGYGTGAAEGAPDGGDAADPYDTPDSYGDDSTAAGDAAGGGSSGAYGEDTDGGSSGAYGTPGTPGGDTGAEGDGTPTGDAEDGDAGAAGGDSGSYGGGEEPAAARVPDAPRTVDPAALAFGALGLVSGAAALIAAGLWARRRVLEL